MNKTFCFDIDGVIMTLVPDNDYRNAKPIKNNIKIINKLFDKGHTIILLTARGYITKIDWQELTKAQLSEFGVKYHELHFGKPAADFYIDDKMITIDQIIAQSFDQIKK